MDTTSALDREWTNIFVHRWENNSKTDLKEIVWKGVEWIYLGVEMVHQLVVINTAQKLKVS